MIKNIKKQMKKINLKSYKVKKVTIRLNIFLNHKKRSYFLLKKLTMC